MGTNHTISTWKRDWWVPVFLKIQIFFWPPKYAFLAFNTKRK